MSTAEVHTIDVTRSLGELVAERPARARVLERAGLDYCCHGARPLVDAAAAAGIDPTELAAELAAVTDATGADVDRLGPVALVDHLVATHHAYLHEELPLLDALAAKVRDVHGSRHPELAEVVALVGEIRADLEPHLAKEETVLFPAIRRLAEGSTDLPFGTLERPISAMLREHDRVGDLLEQLRAVTGGHLPPDDGCGSFQLLYERLLQLETDTHRHVHLENNVLFPAVVELESLTRSPGDGAGRPAGRAGR